MKISGQYDEFLFKVSQLVEAEKHVAETAKTLSSVVQKQSIKEVLQNFSSDSEQRMQALQPVAQNLHAAKHEVSSPAQAGLSQEAQEVRQSSQSNGDIISLSILHKLAGLLLTDYSYAANFAYQYKMPQNIQSVFTSAYKAIHTFNDRFSKIAEETFKNEVKPQNAPLSATKHGSASGSFNDMNQKKKLSELEKQIAKQEMELNKLKTDLSKKSQSEQGKGKMDQIQSWIDQEENHLSEIKEELKGDSEDIIKKMQQKIDNLRQKVSGS
jgi:hypothetical protein